MSIDWHFVLASTKDAVQELAGRTDLSEIKAIKGLFDPWFDFIGERFAQGSMSARRTMGLTGPLSSLR